jgi:hypothetical protein
VFVQNVDRASVLATDDAPRFVGTGREYKAHVSVIHSKGEYSADATKGGVFNRVNVKGHTNSAENFFSIFKHGVIGSYHHLSEAICTATLRNSISVTTHALRTISSAPSALWLASPASA